MAMGEGINPALNEKWLDRLVELVDEYATAEFFLGQVIENPDSAREPEQTDARESAAAFEAYIAEARKTLQGVSDE